MAKTIPATRSVPDPLSLILPRLAGQQEHLLDMLEGANFDMAKFRRAIYCDDFRKYGSGQGIWQGLGSPVDDFQSAADYTKQFEFIYRAKTGPDSHNLIHMVIAGHTGGADIEVRFRDYGDTTTVHTESFSLITTFDTTRTVTGGNFDSDTTYIGQVWAKADVGEFLKIYRFAVFEIAIPIGSMTTGP